MIGITVAAVVAAFVSGVILLEDQDKAFLQKTLSVAMVFR